MKTIIVSGSAGLIGSQVVADLCLQGYKVVGIDNDMRRYFFGESSSTLHRIRQLREECGDSYIHVEADIRNQSALESVFRDFRESLGGIVHTAAQPSHDWAAREPLTDFGVNAVGTINLLELTRLTNPEAPFIFMSTNKVYGDTPNELPLFDYGLRWDLAPDHAFCHGVTEDMSIDHSLHSIFGASKVAADVMVQEYGRYFGMATACLRGGTLTGPAHAAAELHGFMAYLVNCAVRGIPYTVFGYGGKQVRDVIDAQDVSSAVIGLLNKPCVAGVFNIGGGRENNCSVLEAIQMVESATSTSLRWTLQDANRIGDHKWWISNNQKLMEHLPDWRITINLERIIENIAMSVSKSKP